jgi:hypothetical protein
MNEREISRTKRKDERNRMLRRKKKYMRKRESQNTFQK